MTLNESDILSAGVLIVDDQLPNVQLLQGLLAQVGYTNVMGTTNPREVGPLHLEHDFDLILLDLQMPGMDGFEVMEQLRRDTSQGYLPVLVLTAQHAQKLKALQAGAKDFVSKPFDVVEIQTRIRNMLEVRLLYRRVENDKRHLEIAVAERTAELRESEARFRSLVELASDWYWEQDESGAFTKVSGPALEMLGLDEAEGAAGQPQALWNAKERASLDEKLAARRPFLDFVYSRINADGSEQFMQASGEPKFDETGRFRGYRGIGMDVTGRMLKSPGITAPSYKDLQRFRTAMDDTSQAIFLLDRASMRFVDVNAAACRMTGYNREELLALAPGVLSGNTDADDRGAYDRLIEGASEAGISRTRLLHKLGHPLNVEIHRQPSHTDAGWIVVEMMRDVSGSS